MKTFTAIAFLTQAFTIVNARETTGDIKSCGDMIDLFSKAKKESVNSTMYPFQDIICDNFTTITLGSGYDVTIMSSENLENFYGSAKMRNLRFEILNGSKLTMEVNTRFQLEFDEGDSYPDLNGGSLYVGEDSNVVFLNDFSSRDVGVRSQTEEDSDFPDHQNDAGVVYNQGYFRVHGFSEFERCENSGGGEGSPGKGGCVFNGDQGSMLFEGGVSMNDVSITDDEGNFGAGFYNLGKVNVRGDSKFSLLRAESGGSFYNGPSGIMNFKSKSSVLFTECRSQDGDGGCINNRGYMKFSGPVIFSEGNSEYEGGAISVGDGGTTKFSSDLVFFRSSSGDSTGAPVVVNTGGVFEYKKAKTSFLSTVLKKYVDPEEFCNGVYFKENENCVE